MRCDHQQHIPGEPREEASDFIVVILGARLPGPQEQAVRLHTIFLNNKACHNKNNPIYYRTEKVGYLTENTVCVGGLLSLFWDRLCC